MQGIQNNDVKISNPISRNRLCKNSNFVVEYCCFNGKQGRHLGGGLGGLRTPTRIYDFSFFYVNWIFD